MFTYNRTDTGWRQASSRRNYRPGSTSSERANNLDLVSATLGYDDNLRVSLIVTNYPEIYSAPLARRHFRLELNYLKG